MVIISELKELAQRDRPTSPTPNKKTRLKVVQNTPQKRKASVELGAESSEKRTRIDSSSSNRCVTPPPAPSLLSVPRTPETVHPSSFSILELDSGSDAEDEPTTTTKAEDVFSAPSTPRKPTSPAVIRAIPGSPLAVSLEKTMRKRERTKSGLAGGKNLLEEFQREKEREDPLQSPSKKQRMTPHMVKTPKKETAPEADAIVELPESCQSLLTLYNGLERAILVRLATTTSFPAPSKIQNPSTNSVTLQIHNLVTYSAIKQDVERASGKKFSLEQLERLVWVWEGGRQNETREDKDRGGMGWIISKTKELGLDGKQVFSWGIGIQLEIRINPSLPTFELAGEDEELFSGLGSRNEIDSLKGSNLIALWSKELERRKNLFRKKLQRWITDETNRYTTSSALEQDYDRPVSPTTFMTPKKSRFAEDAIPFPTPVSKHKSSSSMDHSPFILPSIPRAHLPSLVGKAKPSTPSFKRQAAQTPTSASREGKQDLVGLGLAGLYNGEVKVRERKGSTKDRQKSLMERIKAKEEKMESNLLLFPNAAGAEGLTPGERKKKEKELLKRRSLLSRLSDVADGVSMLFNNAHLASSVTRSPKSPSTPSSGSKKKAIPLDEVAGAISKSAKISLSKAESLEAVQLLAEISPSFVQIRIIDKREWVSVSVRPAGVEGNRILASPSKSVSTPLKDAKRKIKEELDKPGYSLSL
ncbi:hypothetical protein BT69DRAFT_1352290 [Atractiella rhizophila]|nr:hypothetical protein BT69DRAFT_1352290 [Atractiella rhizophila]